MNTKYKNNFNLLTLILVGSLPLTSFAGNNLALSNLEIVLDGYAYVTSSDVIINLEEQTINVESEIENCTRPNNQPPLNNSNWTLITNNQEIGIEDFHYIIESRLLFLTSETSNVVCDNGLFIDQIFVDGFEAPITF